MTDEKLSYQELVKSSVAAIDDLIDEFNKNDRDRGLIVPSSDACLMAASQIFASLCLARAIEEMCDD